jgi:type II secretory pathway pseudopilin PulG
MNETSNTKSGWRILRRILIGLAILATLIAIFYAEEDWRGKRAWKNCKSELEAKGAVLDWEKFIPPPVPDDQNFFKAPNMQKWFIKPKKPPVEPYTNELQALLSNKDIMMPITNETVAKSYLAWSDQFQSDFDLIREALKRPYARMEGNYSQPFEGPIPNFVHMRALAQVLSQRAKCYLLLGQPEKALREVTLMHDLCRILKLPPNGKPIFLVDAMINVALTGLYVETITDGLQKNAWREPQLAALQEQLKKVNVVPLVLEAFRTEPAAVCRAIEIAPLPKLFPMTSIKINCWSLSIPRGWYYQNMANVAILEQKPLSGFDLANNTVSPRLFDDANRDINNFIEHKSPYRFLAAIAIPNYVKALQTTAHNQTLVNEAQIACALERYRLAHGEYPETLDALVPQFIEKLPHDIIGGQPLHYRRTEGGNFLLYSVGWNETDDGGVVGPGKENNQVTRPGQQRVSGLISNYGNDDRTKGDWVWKN